jgi:hypothetical protein
MSQEVIRDLLNKGVAFAASSHRVAMKIYEFEITEWFENLLYVRLGQIEMQRANVKSSSEASAGEN